LAAQQPYTLSHLDSGELLLEMVIVAMALAWWEDHSRMAAEQSRL